MKIKEIKEMSKNQVEKLLKDESLSKSKKMIQLFEAGMKIKEITELMDVRYNFVYNVVSNYITVNQVEVETTKQSSKKQEIIQLFSEGKTNKEISSTLSTNYNYVYKTIKEYKETLEEKVD
ncbi:hypothetical protein D3C79_842880 [compost metagenome]